MEFDISISKEIEIFYLNKKLFDLLTYRNSSSKVIAVADKKSYSLDDIYLKKSILLILENIEKPGNLGAILERQMECLYQELL